ncbi:MAG: undecaprenyl/decaprenyl-phosphate alpha-N-acetylglucosaminyl 1-phosphate transferase [Bacteroidia bacterium]|nr:undecaprenyl/decaprenyl-phosphate alpha-N-acetylglucosaminyl 1-phosphate transferase [Bacteroidia bacterium]
MMETITDYLLFSITGSIIAGVLTAVMIQFLRKHATKMRLIDKPGHRKVHKTVVPVVGGLAIGLAWLLTMISSPLVWKSAPSIFAILGTGILLVFVGILDDRVGLSATKRLAIQLFCSFHIASWGIRLTSLYGIFGIYELNTWASYLITVVLIAGVINAYNLIDGIDGLAGLLTLVSFLVLYVISLVMQNGTLLLCLAAIVGSLVPFLRSNLSKNKIFLGDGGSMLLGFILVVSGLLLIEQAQFSDKLLPETVVSLVFGLFLVPVLDALRVFATRFLRGYSPFHPDKSHLHHSMLSFKLSHVQSTLFITFFVAVLAGFTYLFNTLYNIQTAIVCTSLFFFASSALLRGVVQLNEWKNKVRSLERDGV